jgi:3-dehydroquinate synthase
MKSINVRAEHDYQVLVGCDWRSELVLRTAPYSRALIIHSKNTEQPIVDLGDTEVFFHAIADGEDGKSLREVDALFNTLGAAGFTRSDVIVAIGGGAVTDVSGFVAATWLRGIDWIAIPTTVAGMVDAAVGGKTGINTSYGKNLVGAFHSPQVVLEDLSWLASLSDRDYAAGLAEVIKCGFIKDASILELLASHTLATIREDIHVIEDLITKSVQVKSDVVSQDFKESFEREILNYGHTFGHAIERFGKYSLRHGEAVAIGMCFIAELAHERGLISEAHLQSHREILTRVGLPTTLPSEYSLHDFDALYALMAIDKKARGSSIRFVVLTGGQHTDRLEITQSQDMRSVYEKVLP